MTTSHHLHPNIASDKAVFPIENESLGRLIAMAIHSRLFGSHLRRESPSLSELGWADSLVSEMGSMPIDDVAKVLGGANACVGLVFDHRRAAAVVNSYRALKREQSDLEFFLTNGATPALLQTLFPTVSTRTIASVRKQLGLELRRGRPRLADTTTAHDIYRCWQALSAQEPNLRVRYTRLKKHFEELSFSTLCAAIDNN